VRFLIDITETYGCSQAAKLLKEFQSSLVLGVEVDYRDYTNEWVKAQIAVARGCGSTACIGLCRVKVVADNVASTYENWVAVLTIPLL